jgi:hypothetical protein
MGTFLDFLFKAKRSGRPTRAKIGIVHLLVTALIIWGGGWVFVDAVRVLVGERGGMGRPGAAGIHGAEAVKGVLPRDKKL